jgi:hypothetical protein
MVATVAKRSRNVDRDMTSPCDRQASSGVPLSPKCAADQQLSRFHRATLDQSLNSGTCSQLMSSGTSDREMISAVSSTESSIAS